MTKKFFIPYNILLFLSSILIAQNENHVIRMLSFPDQHKVIVKIGNAVFTEFIYPDSLEKPVLFPIYAPDGNLVTRGFPLAPRPGEPTDHPHHIGLWLNYENVNGLDFWNNSFAIPKDKKNKYGWIRTRRITKIESGEKGLLQYQADWTDQHDLVLLKESTTFIFSSKGNESIIDRLTTLTAKQDVLFK